MGSANDGRAKAGPNLYAREDFVRPCYARRQSLKRELRAMGKQTALLEGFFPNTENAALRRPQWLFCVSPFSPYTGSGLKSITAQKSPRKVTSLPGNVIKLSVVFFIKHPVPRLRSFGTGCSFLSVHGIIFQVFLQGLLDDERLRDARFFLQYTSSRSSSSGGILNVLAGQSVFLSLSPITRPPFLPRPSSH